MLTSVALHRQTFRKRERLTSRKIIQELVLSGKSINVFPFRMIWLPVELNTVTPVQVAFTVPKRNFRDAADRNRLKRLMREAYRKNKSTLYPFVSGNIQFALLFIYTGKLSVTYIETESKMKLIIQNLAEEITKITG